MRTFPTPLTGSSLTWGGQQRLRVSLHGYNSWWDVDQLLGALDEEWRG